MRSEVIFIFGKRGKGKTTLAKQYLRRAPRFMVFDPLCEYGDQGVMIQNTPDLLRVIERFHHRRFNLAFCPDRMTTANGEVQEFSYFCRLAAACPRTLALVDEVHSVLSLQRPNEDFSRLLRFSRHKDLSVIAVSHRPADVPRIVTYLATKIYVFQLHEPNDIAYLKKIIGPQAEVVRELLDFHYLLYDAEADQISFGVVRP